mgnify:CR=1 FL=1
MKWAFYFAASRTKLADFLRGGCTQTGLRATGQSHHTKIMFRSKTLKTAALLAMLGCATLFSATRVETFTDLALSADSYWNGSDQSAVFQSGSARFYNTYTVNPPYEDLWHGFAYTNKTNTASLGLNAMFVAATGGAMSAAGQTNPGGVYAIGYWSAWDGDQSCRMELDLGSDEAVSGIYVSNAQYTVNDLLNGSSFSKKFGGDTGDDPDYLMLIITGWDDSLSNTTGVVSVNLADYTFADNSLDYILSDWLYVDLSTLGDDTRFLAFTLESSDSGAWGINTPTYFALGGLEISQIPEVSAAWTILLIGLAVVRRRRS